MKCKELVRYEDDKKDTRPSKLDSLPLDLQIAILTRVPAKSLMNVKLVSKMYSSIIRSQRFIKSFSSMSSTQSRFIVALYNAQSDNKLIFLFFFSHDSSSLVPNLEMVIPSVSFSKYSSGESVHGILVVKAEGKLILCNPSTEQAITAPHCPVTLFGYDPIGDQHKLVFGRSLFPHHEHPREHKVLTFRGGQGWRRIQVDFDYSMASQQRTCVNGFVYLSAYRPTKPLNPGLVCFDVRSEKLSYIKAHESVVCGLGIHESVFIEYKGKLASIARYPYQRFESFDFWILEDVETHQWSHRNCVVPLSVWECFGPRCNPMCFPGTNKYGELILAPMYFSPIISKPFYIFYYNVETKNFTRVRLLGIGDDQEFLRSYGFRDSIMFVSHLITWRVLPLSRILLQFFNIPNVRKRAWKTLCCSCFFFLNYQHFNTKQSSLLSYVIISSVVDLLSYRHMIVSYL